LTIQSIMEASYKNKQKIDELRLVLRFVRSLSEEKEMQNEI